MTEPQPNVVAAQLCSSPSVWPTSCAERYARRCEHEGLLVRAVDRRASLEASGESAARQAFAAAGGSRLRHIRDVVRRRCESIRATPCRISPVRGSTWTSPIDQARSARLIHSMPE